MPIVAMLSLTLFLVNWVRFFVSGVLTIISKHAVNGR